MIMDELINKILNKITEKKIQCIWRSCSPDNPPCAICKRIITEMPIRLTNIKQNKAKEIALHIKCINDLGIEISPIPENEFLSKYFYGLLECKFCADLSKCQALSMDEKILIRSIGK